MGVFSNIESALETKLNSVAQHPYIHFENDADYDPTINTRWWRATNYPIDSELATVDGMQKHAGWYQVDVFVPVGEALKTLMDDVDDIYKTFSEALSLRFDTSRIDIFGISRGRVVREESWLKGIIKIDYVCYASIGD